MALPPTPQAPRITDLAVVGPQATFVLSFTPGTPFLDANVTTYFQLEALLPNSSNWSLFETLIAPISDEVQVRVDVPVQQGGANYSYRARAVNSKGASEFSNVATVEVRGIPGQPTITGIEVILGTEGSVSIYFISIRNNLLILKRLPQLVCVGVEIILRILSGLSTAGQLADLSHHSRNWPQLGHLVLSMD